MTVVNTLQKSKLGNPFAALKHRNFSIYWIGMCVSLIGTWMQNIAQPWLAYQLTDSPFLLSLVSAMQFIPVLVLSLFAGVIIDKIPKKRLLILTQSASLLITLVLAILTYTGNVQYWHILLMSGLLGVVNTLDMPARQSFVIELVGKEDLMNAIALNSTVFNLARIIGPALAGLVMVQFGVAACFLINSISFAAIIVSLFAIKPLKLPKQETAPEKLFSSIKSGLRYLYNDKEIFDIILLVAIVATLAMNFNILVPVIVKTVFHMQESGFSALMSFMGIGSFLGSIMIASMSKRGPKQFFLWGLPFVVSGLFVLMGINGNFYLTGILLAVNGFFFIMFSTSCNTTLQLKAKNEYRGRVISIYTLVFSGFTPFGSLIAGTITDFWGANIGFVTMGILILVFMLILLLLRSARKTSSV